MAAVLQEPTGCQLAIYKLCAQTELSIWNHFDIDIDVHYV